MNILIPNSFCYSAIGITKTLKRLSKYQVCLWGTGEEDKGVASGSLLVDEYLKSPSLNCASAYKAFLSSLIDSNSIDMIFCVLDSDLLVLDEIIKEHSSTVYVNPGHQNILLFRDKLAASKAIEKIGINIPRIVMEDAKVPLILREKISVGSTGIKYLDLCESAQLNGTVFVQERERGREFTVDVLCDKDGEPHLIIPRERLEIRNGMSFKTQLKRDGDLIDATKRICHKFCLPGIWNVQFIKNEKGVFFIELNPRISGSSIASITASFNFIDLYIDHFFFHNCIPSMDKLQEFVAWDSIVTRFYEESVFPQHNIKCPVS